MKFIFDEVLPILQCVIIIDTRETVINKTINNGVLYLWNGDVGNGSSTSYRIVVG